MYLKVSAHCGAARHVSESQWPLWSCTTYKGQHNHHTQYGINVNIAHKPTKKDIFTTFNRFTCRSDLDVCRVLCYLRANPFFQRQPPAVQRGAALIARGAVFDQGTRIQREKEDELWHSVVDGGKVEVFQVADTFTLLRLVSVGWRVEGGTFVCMHVLCETLWLLSLIRACVPCVLSCASTHICVKQMQKRMSVCACARALTWRGTRARADTPTHDRAINADTNTCTCTRTHTRAAANQGTDMKRARILGSVRWRPTREQLLRQLGEITGQMPEGAAAQAAQLAHEGSQKTENRVSFVFFVCLSVYLSV
jgi:hypothetical protein